ncbi:membrane-associated phospholipid phosphatase [Aequorivita sublithincola DSM 14238]|uniref:Membrane-associated phospholipid phosphatase n=1 Tax=Aequorivita sublithincola (strain DSM 14238 / LMG 21431 / ACAM 643 / 9-3) TaxID=746697 RepID=I3YZ04_AEQSU|nr:phosphatase PAP2 family protein [Aequorivita sublithincola]AFL82222.1 membrane-associated phospholipid phosphatase [Aequorivita sublithincola DSM 14238]
MKKTLLLLALMVCVTTFAQQKFQNSINSNHVDDSVSFTSELNITTDFISENRNIQETLSSINFESKDKTVLETQKSDSPYEWKWLRDGIWTGVALGASAGGLMLIQKKDDLPMNESAKFLTEESLQKEIDKLSFLDRWVAGNHSESASKISDIPFAVSFVAPFALLFDDEINDHTGQYLGLYIESLATTAALYTITAGLVDRSRPYVYDSSGDTSNDRRFKNNGQRSFYSGHVAATATATFFAAKAYSDFNPDSNGKIYVWAGAAVLPAAVGVFRMEAGQHFLTDVLLGYVLGAGTGILVPELHKRKMENVDIYPSSGRSYNGDSYNGMAFRYTF